MNINRWLLVLLYLYASIQVIGPKFIDFGGGVDTFKFLNNPQYQKYFFQLLLGLKLYFGGILIYWLSNGSFVEYFNTACKKVEDNRSKYDDAGET